MISDKKVQERKMMINRSAIAIFMVMMFCRVGLAGEINLFFGGDTYLSEKILSSFKPEDYDKILGALKPLQQANVLMVNLESPITDKKDKARKKYNFKLSTAMTGLLNANGINIVNLANNHIYDYNAKGLEDTLAALDQAGILHVGAGKDLKDARKPVILEYNNKKIGFLGCYSNGYRSAGVSKPGVCPRYENIILEDIRKLKTQVAYVVVNIHWGKEKQPVPEEWQIKLAHKMVDSGANLVIGHHSHTIQGVEEYQGSIIAYSLGNFMFFPGSKVSEEVVLLHIELADNGTITWEFIPLIANRSKSFQVYALPEEKSKAIIKEIAERTDALEQKRKALK